MARRLSGIIVVGVFSVLTSLAVGVAPALATLYDLNLNNLGIAGSIGTVTTSLVGSSINVSVAMKPGFDMFGNTLTFGFNQVATEGALTISTLTPGYAVGCANCSPLVQYSTFGRFENSITDGVGGATGTIGHDLLSFSVSRPSGFTADTQLTELSTSPGGGFTPAFFAVKFGVCVDAACSAFSTTGFGASNTVPEPGTLALFATGLVGVGALFGTRLFNRGRRETV